MARGINENLNLFVTFNSFLLNSRALRSASDGAALKPAARLFGWNLSLDAATVISKVVNCQLYQFMEFTSKQNGVRHFAIQYLAG